MLHYPGSKVVLMVAMIILQASSIILSLHGLAYKRFNAGGSVDQHVRALRVLSASEVTGYSVGTVIGGVIYDLGGWTACSWFQFACLGVQLICALSSTSVRADIMAAVSPLSRPSTVATAEPMVKSQLRRFNSVCRDEEVELLHRTHWPAVLLMLAHWVNCTNLAVEWSLFTMYFRHEFQYFSMWTGVAQSSGGMIAAGILIFKACCAAHEHTEPEDKHERRRSDQEVQSKTASSQQHEPVHAGVATNPYDNISMMLCAVAVANLVIVLPV
jgi:hypothetical protein